MGEMSQFVDRSEETLPAEMHGVEAYISEDYARAERDKLWRKCWLQAGRLEDIPEVGNYITYDILDDSVLIVRTAPDKLKAFANVCTHRGRRLVDTPAGKRNAWGKSANFVCGFHAWTFDVTGDNAGVCSYIQQKGEWGGALNDANTRLGEFKVDTWGGFIWINLDPGAEPLRDYLEPAATMLDPFQLQNMRPRWRFWTIFDCNWKVALEAFDETYHVPGTHPEFTAFGDFTGWGRPQGKHSHIGYDVPKGGPKELGENKGINLPGVKISAPSMTEKDHADLRFGIEQQVDYVALSFVRSARDCIGAKTLIEFLGANTP